jgi:hypothetical protein
MIDQPLPSAVMLMLTGNGIWLDRRYGPSLACHSPLHPA